MVTPANFVTYNYLSPCFLNLIIIHQCSQKPLDGRYACTTHLMIEIQFYMATGVSVMSKLLLRLILCICFELTRNTKFKAYPFVFRPWNYKLIFTLFMHSKFYIVVFNLNKHSYVHKRLPRGFMYSRCDES